MNLVKKERMCHLNKYLFLSISDLRKLRVHITYKQKYPFYKNVKLWVLGMGNNDYVVINSKFTFVDEVTNSIILFFLPSERTSYSKSIKLN